jgi:hypothetical protein
VFTLIEWTRSWREIVLGRQVPQPQHDIETRSRIRSRRCRGVSFICPSLRGLAFGDCISDRSGVERVTARAHSATLRWTAHARHLGAVDKRLSPRQRFDMAKRPIASSPASWPVIAASAPHGFAKGAVRPTRRRHYPRLSSTRSGDRRHHAALKARVRGLRVPPGGHSAHSPTSLPTITAASALRALPGGPLASAPASLPRSPRTPAKVVRISTIRPFTPASLRAWSPSRRAPGRPFTPSAWSPSRRWPLGQRFENAGEIIWPNICAL